MTIANLLIKSAAHWPDRPAVASGRNIVLFYADLAERAARFAAAMAEQYGLLPGDRVALALKNCPEFCECLLGAWHGGFVVVPMNAKLHAREFAFILENSGAKLCIASPGLDDDIKAAITGDAALQSVLTIGSDGYHALFDRPAARLFPAAPDDIAWLFYTSGTTGFPKGAMLTHRNLMALTLNYFSDVDEISEHDCLIHAAPMSHGSGLYIPPHIAKGALQVIPESGGFEPDEVLDLISHYPGSSFFFAPTMVKRLIDAPSLKRADAGNLKTIVYGGGPMYVEDCLEALDVLGPKLVQIYGQGEAPMTITALSRAIHQDKEHPAYLKRLASVGVPHTGCEVRVVNEDGVPVAPGEVGEIIVSGDVVMKGYWDNPDATAQSLRQGWLYTGDMGAFDAHGFLTLKDRSKDVIISGGSNIYPREVEEVLLQHEDVAEVSVIGRPHPEWGEEILAFIVLKPDCEINEAALDQLCLENIARFKRPKHYRIIDRLPKNNYGKVLKTQLRELAV